MISKDKIILKNLKFYAYHGVFLEEQEKGQNFYIDVEMYTDIKKAGISDELEDTVHYGEVYDIIKDINTNKKFKLIEKLADSISREILSKFKEIEKIKVQVRKPEAPINGEFDWAGVEIERDRNDL